MESRRGAGPAGLTAALYAAKAGHQVTVIDAADSIGGCHRVIRKDLKGLFADPKGSFAEAKGLFAEPKGLFAEPEGLFAEHAPRVYSDSYVNTMTVLRDLGMAWDDVFTPYDFAISSIASKGAVGHLSAWEMGALTVAFAALLIPGTGAILRDTSMAAFMDTAGFSHDAKDYVDRVCRLTDGAGADRYSLWQFLQLANQQMFHGLYQPRAPNDVLLFRVWGDHLRQLGVHIRLNERVAAINDQRQVVTLAGGSQVPYDQVIVAIPPESAMAIQGFRGLFPDITGEWTEDTEYMEYISMAFHYAGPVPPAIVQSHGFPSTPWGIAYIPVSHYWDDDKVVTKTGQAGTRNGGIEDWGKAHGVLSLTITRPNAVSPTLGKSAQDCTADEIIAEVQRQLAEELSDAAEPLREPAVAFLTPGTHLSNGNWRSADGAWIAAAGSRSVPFSGASPRVCTLGTHNGQSWYQFTAMETAVENALALCHNLRIPAPPRTSAWTLAGAIYFIVFVVFLVWLCWK